MEEAILRAIVASSETNLRALAHLASREPKTFYRGSNFDRIDLRGQDLSGFDLTGASFVGAKVDSTTIVDREFRLLLNSAENTSIIVILSKPSRELKQLLELRHNIRKPMSVIIGSILTDAILGKDLYVPEDAAFLIDVDLHLAQYRHCLSARGASYKLAVSIAWQCHEELRNMARRMSLPSRFLARLIVCDFVTRANWKTKLTYLLRQK